MQEAGRIDLLINNAGELRLGLLSFMFVAMPEIQLFLSLASLASTAVPARSTPLPSGTRTIFVLAATHARLAQQPGCLLCLAPGWPSWPCLAPPNPPTPPPPPTPTHTHSHTFTSTSAGLSRVGPIVEQPMSEVEEVMAANYFGVVRVTQASLGVVAVPTGVGWESRGDLVGSQPRREPCGEGSAAPVACCLATAGRAPQLRCMRVHACAAGARSALPL